MKPESDKQQIFAGDVRRISMLCSLFTDHSFGLLHFKIPPMHPRLVDQVFGFGQSLPRFVFFSRGEMKLRLDQMNFRIAAGIAHFFDHPFRLHPTFLRLAVFTHGQMRPSAFQMAICLVQPHGAAHSDGETLSVRLCPGIAFEKKSRILHLVKMLMCGQTCQHDLYGENDHGTYSSI